MSGGVETTRRIRAFMEGSCCLIVEPSSSFTMSLQACLGELGVPLNQIVTAKKFDEARQVVEQMRPKLIITEYDLQPGLGLSLVELQESQWPASERISIIATRNSSDSAVAEAAEGAVDAFILKPFSTDTFRKKMLDTFQRKINPSPYAMKIEDGRKRLGAKELTEALESFLTAKPLDPKPTLACFYAGHTLQQQGRGEEALREFREGRTHQPLHYKCLIGEFEGLMEKKEYAAAYELVGLIRQNYPITSHRLGQIFIAAVFIYHFDDLPGYYDLYLKTDNRTPWLTELTSLALYTAGKYWVAKKDFAKALTYFDMGLTVRGRELSFLSMVEDELLKAGAVAEADAIFAKALPSDVGTPEHARLRFRLDERTLPPALVIERGRKLVADGHGTPEIYRVLVRLMLKENRLTMAESVISRAAQEHPELRAELYALLQEKTQGS